MPNASSADVLEFWFGPPDVAPTKRKEWFGKAPEFDAEIRRRFEPLIGRAAAGACDDWRVSARDALALCIVLDQFPRNSYRGSPRAFATDAKALAVARDSIDRGFDRLLSPVERVFVYLPLEHAEDVACQDLSVRLFDSLPDDADSESARDYARRHRDIVVRFGRFPHRNDILGRTSTPEELAFLREPGSSF